MKKFILFFIMFGSLLAFSSCEDDQEKGEQAALDFCECLRHRSLSKCNEELNEDYSIYFSDEFKIGFDKIAMNSCGYEFKFTSK